MSLEIQPEKVALVLLVSWCCDFCRIASIDSTFSLCSFTISVAFTTTRMTPLLYVYEFSKTMY